jgi:hypothetical protein
MAMIKWPAASAGFNPGACQHGRAKECESANGHARSPFVVLVKTRADWWHRVF